MDFNVSFLQRKYGLIDCDDAGYEVGRKKGEWFTHTSIIIGACRVTGKKCVMQSAWGSGVSSAWIDDYANDEKVFYTDNLPSDRFESLKRAFSLLEHGYDYSLLDNCQDVSHYCVYGNARSKGFEKVTDTMLAGGFFLALFGAVTNDKTLTKIGTVSAVIGGTAKVLKYTLQQSKAQEREVKYYMTVRLVWDRETTPEVNPWRINWPKSA